MTVDGIPNRLAEFLQAFRRHYGGVYRFVRSRAPRRDAEDLAQEVFVAAVVALGEARVESPPPLQWLYTVARRRLVDLARRQRLELAPATGGGKLVGSCHFGPPSSFPAGA